MGDESSSDDFDIFYISFIDVVGIKEASALDAGDYRSRLIHFNDAVVNTLKESPFRKDVKCWIFSDSALLASRDLDKLAQILADIRIDAISKKDNIFIRGSIVRNERGEIIDEIVDEMNKGGIRGFQFGTSGVRAYIFEEKFKGIGISVASNIYNHQKEFRDSNGNEILVPSIHFPQSLNNEPAVCYDISYALGRNGFRGDTLDRILHRFYRAKIKSKKYEKYYITMLMSWIGSFNENSLKDAEPNTGVWDLFSKVYNNYFEQAYKNVDGRVYIYFAILRSIYKNYVDKEINNPPDEIKKVKEYLSSITKMDKCLEVIPDQYFSKKYKEKYIDSRLNHLHNR